jgi:diguanylate cyclase (GGDEF)-like protein
MHLGMWALVAPAFSPYGRSSMENLAVASISVLLVGVLVGALINIRRQNRSITLLLESKSEQLQVNEGELRQLAFFDPLTGLPNRRKILDQLEVELYASERYKRCGALFFIDIDNFKNINDTLGHDHGDKLLIEISRRLTDNVRRSDTVARLGGDEFLILLQSEAVPEERVLEKASSIARKLLHLSEKPYFIEDHKHYVSVSIGITLFPGTADSPVELLRQADTALYKAKGNGKDTVCFFHQDMQRLAESKLEMERDLREALEHDQFSLVYQSQVDADGVIQSAEALLRWEKANGTQVSPADFIPVADETGLILPIGDWVMEAACRQMKSWLDADLPIQHVSVNVSTRQFQHADFVTKVEQTLMQTGLPASCLMIELTEGVVVESFADVKIKMLELIELGVRMSMDDFGTGYSSLSYLSELPFHELKIDQSFVRNLFEDEKNSSITKTIIAMAKSLDLVVLAEGVEKPDQLAFLDEHNCALYQGYLFSEPVPAAELTALVQPEQISLN